MNSKKYVIFSILILFLLLSSINSTGVSNRSSLNNLNQSIILKKDVISDEINQSYIEIVNISGGLGIKFSITNKGFNDISDLLVDICVTGGFFVRLLTKNYQLPLLKVNETKDLKIKIFGFGFGILFPEPKVDIKLKTSYINFAELSVNTKIFGPVIKITGIVYNDNSSFEGYTLFSPEYSTYSYLINNSGDIVHFWKSNYIQGLAVYLLENGNLIRTAYIHNSIFIGGGVSGRIEMFDWNGTLVWGFDYSNDQYCLHHDLEILPNGNILMVAWEYKSANEAIAAGRHPDSLPTGQLWPDHVIEVEPTGSSGGNIVWEWHSWDHLIQDFDPLKENFGVVKEHPELIDINYGINTGKTSADWNHINSIDYNVELDQILLSVHNQNEIWVIDHSTTTEEAAGHSGGNSGKGGDILYRWGNPQVYRAGNSYDQKLFGQHDASWIESNCIGEGNILIFNNGQGRPEGKYSSIDEIVPPVDENGNYNYTQGSAYKPENPIWIYTAENPFDFYAGHISGAQRLPNGNTLICDGPGGRFFEVTYDKKIVWVYKNTYPNLINNQVFKIHRYSPDYPGLKKLFE